MPADRHAAVWDAAVHARATPGGLAVWEVARVEAGRPEWGIDMDDATIPQEANFDELGGISYTKGCYTGQEVVARVHFRGHVNRTIRGLRAAVVVLVRRVVAISRASYVSACPGADGSGTGKEGEGGRHPSIPQRTSAHTQRAA